MASRIAYVVRCTINAIMSCCRRFFLRQVLEIGKNVRIDFETKILAARRSKVIIGDGAYLRSNSKGYHAGMPFPTTILLDEEGSSVSIGTGCRLNGVYIHAKKKIEIGADCVIASGVNILDSNGHELHSFNRTVGRDLPESIVIGKNVWIGLNAVILKGTRIGAHSVIGANSVVKGNFPEFSMIIGNPANLVKRLDIL